MTSPGSSGTWVRMERHVHPPADLVPLVQFAAVDAQGLQQVEPVAQRHARRARPAPARSPTPPSRWCRRCCRCLVRPVRIAGVEFVGTDDTANHVAAQTFRRTRRGSPRTGRSRRASPRRSRSGTPDRRSPGSTARRCRRPRYRCGVPARWHPGFHRPELGLRCIFWLSSRPSLPDCHGNIAPA